MTTFTYPAKPTPLTDSIVYQMEGVARCTCGSKYWEKKWRSASLKPSTLHIVCHSCGSDPTPVQLEAAVEAHFAADIEDMGNGHVLR